MPIPEINTVDRLRAVLSTTIQTREVLTTIHQVDSDGHEYDLNMEPNVWNTVAGRPGMLLYMIPHPMGRKGLWMAAFSVAPGSSYTGSSLNEKRIVTVMEGYVLCNGHRYNPGESMTIEPHERTNWVAPLGSNGVTLYQIIEESPESDKAEELSGCSITPDL